MEKTVLAGRYELGSHIARGGMADVYEAHDQLLNRKVAVKVLHSQYSSDEAFVKRFRREAQAAANLAHPNIVSIYDWGEDGATYFIVMELIDGRSLRDVLKTEGALLPRRAAEIAAEVASALAVAHRAGLVHRDIKPGNIMLSTDGTVRVTDFGIARAWDDSSELTKTGAVIGTATYFSPEQARGVPADERSDVYSLGVVLYEMLAGQPPFSGESSVSVAYQHVQEHAEAPSILNTDIAADLDHVVMRSLDKDPEGRYQTADEQRADLLRFLQGEAPAEVPAGEAPTEVLVAATELPPPTVPPDETYRMVAPAENESSQLPFILIAFALLIVIAVGVFTLWTQLSDGAAGPDAIAVPNVEGLTEAAALAELQQAGFRVSIERDASETVPAGSVIRTQPQADTTAAPNSFVTVVLSLGKEAFPIPPVIGFDRDRAQALLEENGFTLGSVTEQPSSDVPAGDVISQSPPGGERAQPGASVDLVVSSGPEVVVMPDLVGRSERDALFLLGQLGLNPEIEEEFSSEMAEDFVIRTDPEMDVELAPGATVLIVLSQGPEPVQVPNLVGLTPDEALARIGDLDLILNASATRVPTDASLDGRIVSQSPPADSLVNPGTVITVTLGEAPPPTTPPTTSPPDDEG